MTIELKGHLDTSKTAEAKEYIDSKLAKADAQEPIIIDCRELEYISSSGLRIIIGIKKSHPNMEVINVSTEVYNVFDMTGFTRIITIKKALRKIDLSKCQRLARGANGEVYKINDEEIVKLSLFANREDELLDEMNRAREAFLLGVPTMISFDQVEVGDGRKGIVMEALNSTTLAQHLKQHPEQLDSYIKPYVDLFITTNAITPEPGKIRSAKEHLLDRLLSPTRFLDEQMTSEIKSMVEAIPDGENLIHADGHPSNALLCGDNDSRNLMLIDMGDISVGHPILEIMGWSFIMYGPEYSFTKMAGPKTTGLDSDFLEKMFRKMMAAYLNITDEETLERAITAAAYVGQLRLICVDQVRNITPEKQQRTISLAKCTIEHKQEVMDGINLLAKLIDNR